MANDPKVLTVKGVSELLQISATMVYKLAKEGRIPAFKIGTDWRFRTDLVVRWMAAQIKGDSQ
jgi:excisionase family DNA binding protein